MAHIHNQNIAKIMLVASWFEEASNSKLDEFVEILSHLTIDMIFEQPHNWVGHAMAIKGRIFQLPTEYQNFKRI